MEGKIIAIENVLPAIKGTVNDYLTLIKPGLLTMVVLTAGASFALAGGSSLDLSALYYVMLGTAVTGAGAHVLNQWLETDSDSRMNRTKDRPLPTGRIARDDAFVLGAVISAAGIAYLSWTINILTGFLGLLTWASYILLYTPLKTKTSANTWAGAVTGALPPLMGWAAATGEISIEALPIFLILYLWQIPHFLSLAWKYRDDYRKGGMRMIPLDDPKGTLTGRHMLGHAIALFLAALLPFWMNDLGIFYLTGAVFTGAGFVWLNYRFLLEPTDTWAKRIFLGSIAYLPLILVCMMSNMTS